MGAHYGPPLKRAVQTKQQRDREQSNEKKERKQKRGKGSSFCSHLLFSFFPLGSESTIARTLIAQWASSVMVIAIAPIVLQLTWEVQKAICRRLKSRSGRSREGRRSKGGQDVWLEEDRCIFLVLLIVVVDGLLMWLLRCMFCSCCCLSSFELGRSSSMADLGAEPQSRLLLLLLLFMFSISAASSSSLLLLRWHAKRCSSACFLVFLRPEGNDDDDVPDEEGVMLMMTGR